MTKSKDLNNAVITTGLLSFSMGVKMKSHPYNPAISTNPSISTGDLQKKLSLHMHDKGTLYTRRIQNVRDITQKYRLSEEQKDLIGRSVQETLELYDKKTNKQFRTAEYLSKLGNHAYGLLKELNQRPKGHNFTQDLISYEDRTGRVMYNSSLMPAISTSTKYPMSVDSKPEVSRMPVAAPDYSMNSKKMSIFPENAESLLKTDRSGIASAPYINGGLDKILSRVLPENDSSTPGRDISNILSDMPVMSTGSAPVVSDKPKWGLFKKIVGGIGLTAMGVWALLSSYSPISVSSYAKNNLIKPPAASATIDDKSSVSQKTDGSAKPKEALETYADRNSMPIDSFSWNKSDGFQGYDKWHSSKNTIDDFTMMKNSQKTPTQKEIFEQWFGSTAKNYCFDEQKKTLTLDLGFIKGFPTVEPFAKGADGKYHRVNGWKHSYTNLTPEQIEAFKQNQKLPSPIGFGFQSIDYSNGVVHRLYVSGFKYLSKPGEKAVSKAKIEKQHAKAKEEENKKSVLGDVAITKFITRQGPDKLTNQVFRADKIPYSTEDGKIGNFEFVKLSDLKKLLGEVRYHKSIDEFSNHNVPEAKHIVVAGNGELVYARNHNGTLYQDAETGQIFEEELSKRRIQKVKNDGILMDYYLGKKVNLSNAFMFPALERIVHHDVVEKAFHAHDYRHLFDIYRFVKDPKQFGFLRGYELKHFFSNLQMEKLDDLLQLITIAESHFNTNKLRFDFKWDDDNNNYIVDEGELVGAIITPASTTDGKNLSEPVIFTDMIGSVMIGVPRFPEQKAGGGIGGQGSGEGHGGESGEGSGPGK